MFEFLKNLYKDRLNTDSPMTEMDLGVAVVKGFITEEEKNTIMQIV